MIKSKKIEIILNKPHKNSGVKNTITEMDTNGTQQHI